MFIKFFCIILLKKQYHIILLALFLTIFFLISLTTKINDDKNIEINKYLRGKTFKLAASRPLVYQTDGEVTEGVQEFSVKVE
jgi:diacylglycerol kinase family enzyme